MASYKRRSRSRGRIEQLPSGSLRVVVYAGSDPLTGRRHFLREVIPAGPDAAAQAEKAVRRLAGQVDERRHPTTNATLDVLLERYLETLDVAESTRKMYRKYVAKHVSPFIGKSKAGAVDVETLDSLYAELRRCRIHCTRERGLVDHRTPRKHECDERCRPHRCNGLASTTIRHIHYVLSGAYEKGMRWRWVSQNPVKLVDAPRPNTPDPRPPTAAEAAQIVEEAWQDPDWGMLVWLTMVTGARRGELCGLRWSHVDLPGAVLTIRRAIAQHGTERVEKDTKTHQQRRVALDPETVKALTEHFERCQTRCEALGVQLARDAYVFSLAPDSSQPLLPSSVSQRYSRLAKRLDIETHLHCLRHYSATELIAAGVDVRTVAGRLGHGGGGVTTLRVYAAWVAEADQRAAAAMALRRPARPTSMHRDCEWTLRHPRNRREKLASTLKVMIERGDLLPGAQLPGIKVLAREYGRSPSTVKRALDLLREYGLIVGATGEPSRVRRLPD